MLPGYAATLGALGALVAACGDPAVADLPSAAPTKERARVVVAQREGKLRDFPCSQCHDKVVSAQGVGRSRAPHSDVVVEHFDGGTRCGLCHDVRAMNRLRLFSDDRIGFDESHRLCGQCHSEKVKDWSFGAHGKHVGSWRDTRYRLTCADCHNPHRPAVPQSRALPGPTFPPRGIPKGGHR